METAFGHDFGRVRVHADGRAGESALAVHALAYTVGDQIVFGPRQYAPQTPDGARLLAHELTHVLQQRHGSAVVQADHDRPDDAAAEREAKSVADRLLSGPPLAAPTVRATSRSLQRFRIEGCTPADSPADAAVVAGAVGGAVAGIRTTIAELSISPLTPLASEALTAFFGANGPSQAPPITTRLQMIASGLPDTTYVCENEGSPTYAEHCLDDGERLTFAVTEPDPPRGAGRILLCQPRFRDNSVIGQKATMVHEGAHKFLNAVDHGYFAWRCGPSSTTTGLPDNLLQANADSYDCLVQRLGLGQVPPSFVGPLLDR